MKQSTKLKITPNVKALFDAEKKMTTPTMLISLPNIISTRGNELICHADALSQGQRRTIETLIIFAQYALDNYSSFQAKMQSQASRARALISNKTPGEMSQRSLDGIGDEFSDMAKRWGQLENHITSLHHSLTKCNSEDLLSYVDELDTPEYIMMTNEERIAFHTKPKKYTWQWFTSKWWFCISQSLLWIIMGIIIKDFWSGN